MPEFTEQAAFLEMLGVSPDEYRIGFTTKWEGQKWNCYLLVKVLADESLNRSFLIGEY